MKRIAALPAVCCLVMVLGLSAQEQPPAAVAGKWDLAAWAEGAREDEAEKALLTLEQNGGKLAGSYVYDLKAGFDVRLLGAVEGNKISFRTSMGRFSGTVEGDSMQGSWENLEGTTGGSWKARRQQLSGLSAAPEDRLAQMPGKWELAYSWDDRPNQPINGLLTLEQHGGNLKGSYDDPRLHTTLAGEVEESRIWFRTGEDAYWGSVEYGSGLMQGTVRDAHGARGNWTAKRRLLSGSSGAMEQEPAPQKPAAVAGKWDFSSWPGDYQDKATKALLTLEQDGGNLKGIFDELIRQSRVGGAVAGNTIWLKVGFVNYSGSVEGDSMQGSWQSRGIGAPHGIWKANRRK